MEMKIEKAIADVIKEQMNNATKENENMEVLTPYEAVELLGSNVSYSTLMRECRHGNIPHFKIGSRVYMRKAKLMEWIEAQEHVNK